MAKTIEVTESLNFLVDMSLPYSVNDDGYVIVKKDDPRDGGSLVMEQDRDESKPILVYQEEIKDPNALVLNPYAEGLGTTTSAAWFYNLLRTSLVIRIITVMKTAIKRAVIEKNKTEEERKKNDDHIPMEFLSLISIIIEHADDKLIKEFELISQDHSTLFNVYYNSKNMFCLFRCALLDDPEWREQEQFSSIRKRSWTIFQKLLFKMFLIDDETEPSEALKKYTKKANPNPDAAPKLSAYLATLFAVYYDINVLLDHIGFAIDLGEFRKHLDKIPEYTNNAKFMMQPTSARIAPTPNQIPGAAQPMVPSVAPTVPGVGPYAQPNTNVPASIPANITAIPGPMRADGTQSPPTLIQSIPGAPPVMVGHQTQAPIPGVYPQQGYPTVPQGYAPPGYYPPPQQMMYPPGYGYPPPGYQQMQPIPQQVPLNPYMGGAPPNMGYIGPGGMIPPGRLF